MSYDVRVYSRIKDGSTKVSQNFAVKEFACKDGSDVIFINPALITLCQTIRNHFSSIYPGAWVEVTSGYRTVAYNNRVSGSSSESQHCNGNAADIVVKYGPKSNPIQINPKEVADYAEKLMPTTGGIGRYKTFTHVDVRAVKARWNG